MAGTSPYTSPYPTTSSGKELDLRKEIYRLLYGAIDEEAKGRWSLLRRMRRDSNGNRIRCACRDTVTDEPDKDYYCRYCLGMGYYWDEVPILQYRDKTSFKKASEDNREFVSDKFFVEYDTIINDEDYIVTVKLDASGNPVTPVAREKYFKIVSAVSFRSDNGRIEFWEVRTKEEFQWSIWYGVQRRQS
jgi:hypothetical protein